MSRLLKTINKFNGNLCFVGATDGADYVFECDRQNSTLSYAESSKLIKNVSLYNSDAYMICFSDNWIGLYQNGILNENCANTGIAHVDQVIRNTTSEFYVLNRTDNQLTKSAGFNFCTMNDVSSSSSSFADVSSSSSSSSSSVSFGWTIDLPDFDLREQGHIILRESDGVIIYYNNQNIHIVRDDDANGVLIRSMTISSANHEMKVLISSEFAAAFTYGRYRMVSGKELEQSSSSSSSSTSSSSSSTSSSTSMSSSSSTSSSSWVYSSSSSTSSTSSFGYSSSSSFNYSSSSSTSSSSSFEYSSSSESSSSSGCCLTGVDFANNDYNGCWEPISGSGINTVYQNVDSGAQLHWEDYTGVRGWWIPDVGLINVYFFQSESGWPVGEYLLLSSWPVERGYIIFGTLCP